MTADVDRRAGNKIESTSVRIEDGLIDEHWTGANEATARNP